MKLLLDTHTLLWWLDDLNLLSVDARKAIKNGRNTVYVSVAVVWEIVIKKSLGKLTIPDNLEDVLAANRFLPLLISLTHVLSLQTLPPFHRDPFDHMLVGQAICDGLTVVSRDPQIQKYPVSYLVA